MAEVIKVIELADGTLTNMVDKNSKLSVNYKPVTTWYDGTVMDASKVDGDLYTKKGLKFYRKVIDKDGELFLEKDTVAQVRVLTAREILYLKAGVYKGVKLNGYYAKGDTPASIEYYISDTTEEDDGGSVIVVGGIKLEHVFKKNIDILYFGGKYDGVFDNTTAIQRIINKGFYVEISNINCLIKGTIVLRKNTGVIGIYVSNPRWVDAESLILHYPTVSGTDLFTVENPQVGYGYLAGIKVENLTIKGNENSRYCFNLKNVANSEFKNLYTDTFVSALYNDYSMNVLFSLCNFSENSDACVRFVGGISTTTVFDRCYLHFSKWGAILEHDTCLGIVFKDTIVESCSHGGYDIHTDNIVDFIGAYAENVPIEPTPNVPIIQVGVNGVEKNVGYPTARVSFFGGNLAGCNFGIDPNSVSIITDKIASLTFYGVSISRANRLIDNTFNSRIISFYGCSFFEIGSLRSGITNKNGVSFNNYNNINVPFNYQEARRFNLIGNSNWSFRDEFNQTDSDFVLYKNENISYLINNNNSLSWGNTRNMGNATNVFALTETNGDFSGASYSDGAYIYSKRDNNGLIHMCTRDSAGDEYMNGVLVKTSSSRPIYNFLGRQIFDSTLGIPIWWNGVEWVDSSGIVV